MLKKTCSCACIAMHSTRTHGLDRGLGRTPLCAPLNSCSPLTDKDVKGMALLTNLLACFMRTGFRWRGFLCLPQRGGVGAAQPGVMDPGRVREA